MINNNLDQHENTDINTIQKISTLNELIPRVDIIIPEIKNNKSYIGYISTSDQIIFGKNKKGKIIYQIKLFIHNNIKILISYNSKLKGKIILLFKITRSDFPLKIPFSGTTCAAVIPME